MITKSLRWLFKGFEQISEIVVAAAAPEQRKEHSMELPRNESSMEQKKRK